jgi:hypothetical protein
LKGNVDALKENFADSTKTLEDIYATHVGLDARVKSYEADVAKLGDNSVSLINSLTEANRTINQLLKANSGN